MSTLQWMLALALLHCFTASPIFYEQVSIILETLINKNCLENDAKFYSPSVDEGKKCVWEALNCSVTELDTVETECFIKYSEEYKAVKRMKDLLKDILNDNKPQNATCICESSQTEEKPYKEFLDNIKKLYQQLNSS